MHCRVLLICPSYFRLPKGTLKNLPAVAARKGA